MAEKKQSNPFDIFNEVGTKNITVKALNNAKVEIKTALTVEQENNIKATRFAHQEVVDGKIYPNESDFQASKTQAVSYMLVSPKMTMLELGELHGATEAINEIYEAYIKERSNKGN